MDEVDSLKINIIKLNQANPVKKAIFDANVLVSGHFVFAEGKHSLQKLEMDHLWDDARSLEVVLGEMKRIAKEIDFDVLCGVPTGGTRLAEAFVKTNSDRKKLITLKRVPGKGKRDFELTNLESTYLLQKAKRLLIVEDVVSSLGSVNAVVRLLRKFTNENVEINCLAIWRRDEVKPKYGKNVSQHYLIEEVIPSFDQNDCPYIDCAKISTIK